MKTSARKMLLPLAIAASFGGGFALSQATADQPLMHQALDQLNGARDSLIHANSDKGGHRMAAIRATEAAIRETQMGIQYDRYH